MVLPFPLTNVWLFFPMKNNWTLITHTLVLVPIESGLNFQNEVYNLQNVSYHTLLEKAQTRHNNRWGTVAALDVNYPNTVKPIHNNTDVPTAHRCYNWST